MNDKNITDKPSYKVLENSAVFSNPHSFFVFKKIERITYALYLVTSHFSENEPLKWSIRNASTSLVNDVISITKRSSESQIRHLRNINRSLIELSSYLELSEKTALVSYMNFKIINDEVRNISSQIESAIKGQFNVEEKKISEDVLKSAGINKGHQGHETKSHDAMSDIKEDENTNVLDKKTEQTPSITHFKKTESLKKNINQDDRSAKILNVIKEVGEVSIKDISDKIGGVSEKTVQRDLVKLINEKKIKKEGERRWSKYSILH